MNVELYETELKSIRNSKEHKEAIKLLQAAWDAWIESAEQPVDATTESAVWDEWIAGLEDEIREEG